MPNDRFNYNAVYDTQPRGGARWYRAYKICLDDGKILEYSMVMTETHELYSVLSSR